MELWNVWYNGLYTGTVRALDVLQARDRARRKYGSTRAEVTIRPCSPTPPTPRFVTATAAECVTRVRALAMDALRQYNEETAAGGDPAYPNWVDDVLVVVAHAELSMRAA